MGNTTYGTVTGPDNNGNWSASFPTLATGEEYTLTAQAQMNNQTASQSIYITVQTGQ
jgi:hypothetical protein